MNENVENNKKRKIKKDKFKKHSFNSTYLSNLFEKGRFKLKKDDERSKRVKEMQYQSQDDTCCQELHAHVKSKSLKNETYEEAQEELKVIPAWRLNLDS